jgi:hypothetical protein
MHTVSYFESFLCGIPNTTPTRSFYEPTNKRKCGVLPNTPVQVIGGSGRVYEMTIAHSCVRFGTGSALRIGELPDGYRTPAQRKYLYVSSR